MGMGISQYVILVVSIPLLFFFTFDNFVNADERATVKKPSPTTTCSLFDPGGGVVLADSDQFVITKNGDVKLTCKKEFDTSVPPFNIDKAIHFDTSNTGFPCFLPDGGGGFVPTLNWKEVISKNGQATLTCHSD